MITDKAQRFQDFLQIVEDNNNNMDVLLEAKNYTKKELQDFETELGKCFHNFILHSYNLYLILSYFFIDKLKAKEGKLTEDEARGKVLMQKEKDNILYQMDRMHSSDRIVLEDGLLVNEQIINDLKRQIEFYEKQNKIAKYIIKLKTNTNNNSLNNAFDAIDNLRVQIRRRERLANSH